MKINQLNKAELIKYCKSIGIDTGKKSKQNLIEAFNQFRIQKIKQVKSKNKDLELLRKEIEALAKTYAKNLKSKIENRKVEMQEDNTDHYLIYKVLGISFKEGKLIDEYQNTGRFLYKYAGSFLEEATSLCLEFKNPEGKKTKIKNNQGQRPKTFEIDFLDGNNAIEIKWRDATTDGDHITKEHSRVRCIQNYGYKPIRIMFYYPQRRQAQKIQETLKTIYLGVNGAYYADEEAWKFIKNYTNYDLKAILKTIADKRIPAHES